MAVETSRIFSAFLVVHFDKEEVVVQGVKGPKGAVIDYSWPCGELLTDDQKQKIKSAGPFAVPFHGYDVPKEAVESFTFTLTSGDYDKTYGFCRYSPSLGKSLCILSSNQWFEFFYALLDRMARHVVEKDKDPEPVCQRLSTLDMWSGKVTEITLTELGLGIWKVPEIPSPNCLPKLCESKNLLEYYSATSKSPDTMIAIFTMLLLERSVVFFASKLGRLTACIHAATSLLYPLSWQHVIIPVLPSKMLEILGCPSPSIFGVVKGLRPEVQNMFRQGMGENLIEVDLDTNEILCPEDFELTTLPLPVHYKLQEELKSMTMDKRGQLRADPWHKDSFPRCFMNALVALIGSYRSGFAAQSDNNSSIDTKFQEEKFFATRPDEYRPFLEKLVATHQFQLFFENRRSCLNVGNQQDPFDNAARDFTLPPTPPKKLGMHLFKYKVKIADALSKAKKGAQGAGMNMIDKVKQMHHQRPRSDIRRSGSVPELSDAKVKHESVDTSELVTRRYDVIATGDTEEAVLYTTSLLDDPDLQAFLRKSRSLEDLLDDEVPPMTPPPPPTEVPSEPSRPNSTERPRPRALTREAPILKKPERPPPPLPSQRPLSRITMPPVPSVLPAPSDVLPRPKPRTKLRHTLERPPRPVDPILQSFDPLCNSPGDHPRPPMPDLVMSARPQTESVYYSACSETFHTPRSSNNNSLLDIDSPDEAGKAEQDANQVYATWLAKQKAATLPTPIATPRGSSGSSSFGSKWETFD